MVSVDVKHHVYLLFPLTGEGHTRSIVCLCFIAETDIDVNVMKYIYIYIQAGAKWSCYTIITSTFISPLFFSLPPLFVQFYYTDAQ